MELVIFKCKEPLMSHPHYNECIIGKDITNGNPFTQQQNPLKLSINKAKGLLTEKVMDVPCLSNLRTNIYYGNGTNQIRFIFDDVKFECDQDLQKPESRDISAFEKMCFCANNMRKGKCPYLIAQLLYPHSYKNKER